MTEKAGNVISITEESRKRAMKKHTVCSTWK